MCYKSDTAQLQRCTAAAAAAQVQAGDERVLWLHPCPPVQQARTLSSSREGLFIFLKGSQFCQAGSAAPRGELSCGSSGSTEPKTRPAPQRMGVLCLGPLQKRPLSSRAPLQGEFRIVQRDREGFFPRHSATMGGHKPKAWCKQQPRLWHWTRASRHGDMGLVLSQNAAVGNSG